MDASPASAPGSDPPRRRGGGTKRKAAVAAAAAVSAAAAADFPPPKRHAKDRAHGPLTRARHSPQKPLESSAAAAAALAGGSSAVDPVRIDEDTVKEERDGPSMQVPEDVGPSTAAVEAKELLIDAEFEAIRSRGPGVHVIPTFAGWFSWKNIHSIEKQSLGSFFNGKLEGRTSEMYMEIRNFIMRKFHSEPQVHVEMKDLDELSVGDKDSKKEIFDFLDHWGLINFHPFLPTELDTSKSGTDHTVPEDVDLSLIDRLYRFEIDQSCALQSPERTEPVSVPLPSLLPESSLTEDFVTPVEPSVEYHCNSCSGDCSRKRYHCRTQADFDLCCDCFNEGKLDSGMTPGDFILMDSVEPPSISGASWTDEETLLLLEAIELFKDNWSEISLHVATKNKAQCLLHFLQMPIVDPFLDGQDVQHINNGVKDNTSAEKNSTDVAVAVEEKVEVQDKEVSRGDNEKQIKISDAKNADVQVAPGSCNDVDVENNNLVKDFNAALLAPTEGCSTDTNLSNENMSDALDVLKSAFQDVGYFPEQDLGSFAEAGNPVMAVAAFLAGLVQQEDIIAACSSSLKALPESSPSLQLAMRHCFILEDPPDDVICTRSTLSATQNEEVKGPKSVGSKLDIEYSEKDDKATSGKESDADNLKEFQEDHNLSENVRPTNESNGDESLHAKPNAQSSVEDKSDFADKKSKGRKEPPSQTEIGDAKLEASDKPDNSDVKVESNAVKGEGSVQEHNLENTDKGPAPLENGEKTDFSNSTQGPAANGQACVTSVESNVRTLARLKRAAATSLSAAAVKAKLLAKQEEDQIRQLAAVIIEKQLHKMEVKLSLFADVDNMIARQRETIERSRHRLLHERSQIIAARLGVPAPPFRPNQALGPTSRLQMGYGPGGARLPVTAAERLALMRKPGV